MNRRASVIAIFALALPLGYTGRFANADGEEIAVIVHKKNGIAAMSKAQLSAIFKAKSTEFPGDGRAAPVNLPPDNVVRREFDFVVLGMRPDEVERFWLDSKIRSGVGSPRRLSGPDAVIHYVASDESAIGYVARSDADDSVRVVARIRGGQVVAP
jgi:ABC-type phosphate transport system substrate-binding protein